MDKTEYHLKLEEINRFVDAQDYEGALTIADSIDWRRVKSVRTLCMVADIYEVNGELEKSMQMLQLAHKRSSIGKMILYRQVELALKMGLYDDAVKYYNQYLETASNDTSKYILKYKIYKAQKAPLEDQIAILEEYKEREYTERWVYELAKLYKKAGQEKKCIETCDDLVLWFGEGKYVTKAMELKMTYTPLSPSQKEKYEKAKAAGETSAKPSVESKQTEDVTNTILPGVSAAAMASLQKAEAGKEQAQEEAAATVEIPQENAEESAAAEEESVKQEEEVPHIDTEKLQERLSRSFQEILSGFNRTKAVDAFEALGRAAGAEVPQEPEEEENIEEYHVQDLEPEAVNEGIISADSGVAGVSRTEMGELEMMEKPKVEKPEDKEIVSVQEVDLDALFAETSSSLAKEAGGEVPADEPTVEEVTTEEIIGEPEEVVAEETVDASGAVLEEETVEEPADVVTEENEPADVTEEPVTEEMSTEPEEKTAEDLAADEAMAAFEASLSDFSLDFEEPEENAAEPTQEEAVEAEDVTETAEEPIAEEETTEPEEAEPVIEMEYPEETVEPEVEDLDATRVIPDVTEQDAWHATPGDTQEFNLEEELKAALGGMDEFQEQEEAEQSASLDLEPETEAAEITFEEEEEEETEPTAEEEPVIEETVTEETSDDETDEPEEDHIEKMLAEAEMQPDISDMTVERETPEEKRQRILNNTRPERLTPEQKQLFSYFAKVPGMDEQILDAIHGAYEHASEKTSHRGNIAIMGSHGTGKTRLSEGLVKAICKELGLEAAKYANLDASDVNRKDPATIISKMAGGFLLIERASFMTPETIEKLSQAMDFRTDSLILLIEDDKANMRKMLADYPEFAEKFETVISIPVFTNDELVTFARTYARENGFRMDEMGVLALYTMIGDNQKEDEPITIGKVKEMVDGAIRKASGVKLGRKLSKRHTDAEGRILLYEKDFDL